MIVDCEGSSIECGLCHGEEARELIRYAIIQWEEEILSKLFIPFFYYGLDLNE